MTSPPTIESKFLPSKDQLGVIAVGFSGGQVQIPPPPFPHLVTKLPLTHTPQCKPGVDAAPTALIEAGLLVSLSTELGYTLHHDNIVHSYSSHLPASDPPLLTAGAHAPMLNSVAVSNVTKAIADQVYDHASQGRLVLTLGGDHSIAIGTIAGTARAIRERLDGREMAVVWIDAHADINTPESSGSGNIHGMPVSFLTGLSKAPKENPDVFGWIKAENLISVTKLVYIGLRDVDVGEKKILRENRIKAFSMHDVDRYGIGRVMEMALEHINCGPGQVGMPVHLSFDVDALDPQV